MLYTYPSNRLENLVSVLDVLMQATPKASALAPDTVLVQHPGMQHWLSMALAEKPTRHISMNIDYPLPVRFFWDLIRALIGPDKVPQRSNYTREILVWRIDHLLGLPEIMNHADMAEPTGYWQKQSAHLQASRRFQLAEELADLFEQYLMYRPEWILEWEAGKTPHWQAFLWQQLVAQDPNHPLALLTQAMKLTKRSSNALPSHFFVFGVNTLAPLWLDFLSRVADEHDVDIHFLYLNPSAEYWDDLKPEAFHISQQLKLAGTTGRADWIDLTPQNTDMPAFFEASNPLLTQLGQQGQAFVRLLSEQPQIETAAFSQNESTTVLAAIQNGVLAATKQTKAKPLKADSSLQISVAHTAFREVQGLRDWLLHRFNNDTTLTPKDVLVMCPNVEEYAPFIQAVFLNTDPNSDTPSLPCSIADRHLKHADPTVAVFLELLTLPDARFSATQLMNWLKTPAIADKFEFSNADLRLLTHWVSQANIHWGFDQAHKTQWLEHSTQHFTWAQGLERLLVGFAYGDGTDYVNGIALLDEVEGENAVLLGKFIHLLNTLKNTRSTLTQARTPNEWQRYLTEHMTQALLSEADDFQNSQHTLMSAINNFTDFANSAQLENELIELSVVRYVLDHAFSGAHPTSSQFMTGQITVCSMVPMRSIPFKVIAVLGLNDGAFPRLRQPLGFDLMAEQPPKLGDRSRRGDDRYLFLEAILSAREALYLSYEGFDHADGSEKPPSLVISELTQYLKQTHQLDAPDVTQTLALHPSSAKNYQGNQPSFEQPWSMNEVDESTYTEALNEREEPTQWQVSQWAQFFAHPAEFFAKHRLGVYFIEPTDTNLEDDEPFEIDNLKRYVIQSELIEPHLKGMPVIDRFNELTAQSTLPVHLLAEQAFDKLDEQVQQFTGHVTQLGATETSQNTLTVALNSCELLGHVQQTDEGNLLEWRLADIKPKDLYQLWFHHLLANSQQPVESLGLYRGKDEKFTQVTLAPTPNATDILKHYEQAFFAGLNTPHAAHGNLVLALAKDAQKPDDKQALNEKLFSQEWDSTRHHNGLEDDAYLTYFWPNGLNIERTMEDARTLNAELLNHIRIESVEANA